MASTATPTQFSLPWNTESNIMITLVVFPSMKCMLVLQLYLVNQYPLSSLLNSNILLDTDRYKADKIESVVCEANLKISINGILLMAKTRTKSFILGTFNHVFRLLSEALSMFAVHISISVLHKAFKYIKAKFCNM